MPRLPPLAKSATVQRTHCTARPPPTMNSLRTGLPKLARGFASAAVQAPIQMHSLEGRYATALFTAASKAKSLTAVETDLRAFNASLHADAEFRAFIESPVVDTKYKTQAVKAVAAKKNFNATTTNFFTLLAENGRLDMSVAVLESFGQLMSAHRGEIPVVVTSSQPLDTKTLNRVRDALAKGGKFTAKNQTLIVSNKVNPSILGGMIVEVGDQTIDMSVSSKMAKIEKALAESV